MIDDLARLQKCDPATYKKILETELTEYEYDDENDTMTGYIYQENLIDSAKSAWLQACLQEAIAVRGWQGIVLFNSERNRAVVEDIIDGMGGTRKLSEKEGDSPAVALLAAYLAAIGEDHA